MQRKELRSNAKKLKKNATIDAISIENLNSIVNLIDKNNYKNKDNLLNKTKINGIIASNNFSCKSLNKQKNSFHNKKTKIKETFIVKDDYYKKPNFLNKEKSKIKKENIFSVKENKIKSLNIINTKKDIAIKRHIKHSIIKYNKQDVDKLFKCNKCDLRFGNRLDHLEHMDMHEDYALYSCTECNYYTMSRRNFEKHEWCHVIDAPFQCHHCSYSSIDELATKRHEKYYHESSNFKIEVNCIEHNKSNNIIQESKEIVNNCRIYSKKNVENNKNGNLTKVISQPTDNENTFNFVSSTTLNKPKKRTAINCNETQMPKLNPIELNSSNENTLDYNSTSSEIPFYNTNEDLKNTLGFSNLMKRFKSSIDYPYEDMLKNTDFISTSKSDKTLTTLPEYKISLTGKSVRILVVWLEDSTPNYWFCVECKKKYKGRREANRHTKGTHKISIRCCDIVNCWGNEIVDEGKFDFSKIKPSSNSRVHICPRCLFKTNDLLKFRKHLIDGMINDCKTDDKYSNGNNEKNTNFSFLEYNSTINNKLSNAVINDIHKSDFLKTDMATNSVESDLLKRYKCSECVYVSDTKSYVVRHIKRVHYKVETNGFNIVPHIIDSMPSNITTQPNLLKKNLSKSENVINHANISRILRPTSDVESKRCKICPFSAHKDDILKHHMSYHRPNERNNFVCNYCPFYVNTTRLLHSHLLLHEPWKVSKNVTTNEIMNIIHRGNMRSKYFCEYCPYVVNDRMEFWKHQKLHSLRNVPMDALKCEECTFWTIDRKLLSEHYLLHLKFFCPSVGRIRFVINDEDRSQIKGLCRCDYAAACPLPNIRPMLECGKSIPCGYCNYKVSSIYLMRLHYIFHISFTDAVLTELYSCFLDDADSCLFQQCAYAHSDIEADYDDMPILERIDYSNSSINEYYMDINIISDQKNLSVGNNNLQNIKPSNANLHQFDDISNSNSQNNFTDLSNEINIWNKKYTIKNSKILSRENFFLNTSNGIKYDSLKITENLHEPLIFMDIANIDCTTYENKSLQIELQSEVRINDYCDANFKDSSLIDFSKKIKFLSLLSLQSLT